jgi:hypothetical protein
MSPQAAVMAITNYLISDPLRPKCPVNKKLMTRYQQAAHRSLQQRVSATPG